VWNNTLGRVEAYINGSGTPILTYTDASPLTGGFPGVRLYCAGTPANVQIDSFSDGPDAILEQEGSRFYNDDGGESSATASQAQDTDDTVSLGVARIIRFLINGTNDPGSIAYTLYAQKNGSGGYIKVPVGASVTEAYGTVTFGAIGTGANGSTSVAPSYPTGITADQYLTCQVSSGGTGNPTPSTPSGWTLLGTSTTTDGTYGVDTGPRRITVFGKIADGSETGTLTVSITSGDSCRGTICRWTKAGSGSWVVDAVAANDSGAHTGISMTAGASLTWNTGDATMVANSQRVDSVTQSSQSLTATGVTFGTRTNRAATAVTTGNDHRHTVDTFAAISSTSNVTAAPTWAYTASAAASSASIIVRLREYTAPVTNDLYVATSSNITASGEATTARLTAPSGKSTSDFVTGRIWDDENGSDSIDITADDYTEVAWCVKTQSPAVDTDYWEFKVYAGTSPFDTYTVTPKLTLSSAGATVTASDTFTVSDSAVSITQRLSVASDTNTPTDSSVSVTTRLSVATDTNTPTDSAISGVANTCIASDTVSFSDSAVNVSSLVAVAVDTNTPTDSAVSITQRISVAVDTNTPTDSAVSVTERISTASDTNTPNDSAVSVIQVIVVAVDTNTLTDTADSVTSRLSVAEDTISVSDSAVGQSVTANESVAEDSISLTDSSVSITQRLSVADDTISLTDSAISGVNNTCNSSDTITFTDNSVSVTTRISIANDTINLTDSSVSVTQRISLANDTISFTDSAIGDASASAIASANDTIIFDDSSLSISVRISISDDSIIFNDSATSLVTVVSNATDNISFNDSAESFSSLLTIGEDTIILSDSAFTGTISFPIDIDLIGSCTIDIELTGGYSGSRSLTGSNAMARHLTASRE
jgi:hypothetical protein